MSWLTRRRINNNLILTLRAACIQGITFICTNGYLFYNSTLDFLQGIPVLCKILNKSPSIFSVNVLALLDQITGY